MLGYVGQGIPTQRGLSTTMDIQVHWLGKEVHGPMVPTHHAIPDRADEGCSPNDKDTSRANIELVRSQRNHISGCSGGSEQQKQSDYQIIIRIQHLSSSKSHAFSYSWRAADAGPRPQILLKS